MFSAFEKDTVSTAHTTHLQGPVLTNPGSISRPEAKPEPSIKAKVLEMVSQPGKRLTSEELEQFSQLISGITVREDFSYARKFLSPRSRPEELPILKERIASGLYQRGIEIDPFILASMQSPVSLDLKYIMDRLKVLGIESFGAIESINDGLNSLWQIYLKRDAR